jgi:IS1 transposase
MSNCQGHPHEVLLRRVEAEADEMCSFVKKKAHKQWLWLAMEKATGQIIAYHVGDRSRDSARQLWANLPTVYRERPHSIRISTKSTKA